MDQSKKETVHRVQKALLASSISDLRELRVEHAEDALHLHGHVSCFYHMQLAQETARSIAGDLAVVNSIAVR
ncbi:MAG: BON domain-containing protein [Planctomycetota bacterium]|nr:BON domain-containing protein [Planctomycetota bacterium]